MAAALAAALAATLAAACSHPACPPSTYTAPGPAAPLLWRVQAAGGGPVVWLYGTLHDLGLADVPPAALAALDGAPRFASELGDIDPDPDTLRRWARQPRGLGLDQRLPMDDWWDLRDALLPVIKEDDLARVRPWYAMSLLTTHLAPGPVPSMDFALTARAGRRGTPVDALETWEQQLTVIDASVDDRDLLEALHARRTLRCEVGELSAVYRAGDAVTLDQLLRSKHADLLLTARNHRWLPAIERYLAPGGGGAFVAVGVAHLTSDVDGLPALLARDGYVVTRATP